MGRIVDMGGSRLPTRASEYKAVATRSRAEQRAFLWHELKALDDNAGIIEGYVAVFGNLDGNGDVIDRGAFTKTLREAHETKARQALPFLYPLLWQHNEKEPIGGILEAHEDDHGLFIRGQYDLETERGRQAYSGAKKGYLRGLSIGYDAVRTVFQSKARHLLEIRLWEGSPVTFPANPISMITSVKSQGGPEEDKGVSGKTDWPLSDKDHPWDAGAAHGRLLKWAGGKDDLDTAKFSSVHFWSPDGDAKENVSEYKFPFCDVIGGEVKAVWKAITAATGSHGVQAAKDVDVEGIKGKISTYYGRAAKQYDDATIKVPWSSKALNERIRAELKDLTGLNALTGCARTLDCICDGAEGYVETLAGACGMSMESGDSTGKPEAPVAALLAGVDGLEDAVKAVITAWQEFDQQTDALLAVLGLPDDDTMDSAVPMYMSSIRSAFELKAGRQLSATNRKRLSDHMGVLAGQVEEVKSILADNDKGDEMDNNADYGDVVASGRRNQGKAQGRGQATPGALRDSTSPGTTSTPDADASTLAEIEASLLSVSLNAAQHRLAK